MKKTTFLSFLILSSIVLTSCLPDSPGNTYTSTFPRLVTINHSTEPPRFYADYTNEEFVISNINTNDDLKKFKLEDADRALIYVTLNVVDYDAEYILERDSYPLDINPVCNKDLTLDESFGPVYGFSRLEVESTWAYPYAWVSHGYLSILPQVKVEKDAESKHYLVPEGVSNDTLSFSLHSQYESGSTLRADYVCFDLQTLGDTASADAEAKSIMKSMVNKLNSSADSVMVVVVADYLKVWPDTIIKTMVPTNYFYLRID